MSKYLIQSKEPNTFIISNAELGFKIHVSGKALPVELTEQQAAFIQLRHRTTIKMLRNKNNFFTR